MALRVLLADNSETIKKVIQLSLQDFGVDLKVVSSGVDVIGVAETFHPEIIFVDILLQKISGYDVGRMLKTHPTLKSIPVILMWSGFMDLDEEKAADSLADARLEKPFDAETIKGLVTRLTAKKSAKPEKRTLEKPPDLNSFLEMPDNITSVKPFPPLAKAPPPKQAGPVNIRDFLDQPDEEIEETPIKEDAKLEAKPENRLPDLNLAGDLSNDVVNHGEDFQHSNLTSLPDFAVPSAAGEEFSIKPTESYEMPSTEELEEVKVDMHEPEAVKGVGFLLNADSNPKFTVAPTRTIPANGGVYAGNNANLTQNQLEELIKQQCHEIIEKMAWKLVPELSAKIIKEELTRLLRDTENKL